MWFLWFYLISTAISLLIVSIKAWAINTKIRRDNLEQKRQRSKAEKASAVLPFLVPFLNILIAIALIFISDDRIYKSIKD